MENLALSNFIDTKSSETVNAEKYINSIKTQCQSLEEELKTVRIRHDRDRNKLKFYKGEYIGFEVARKKFEEE